MANLDETLRQSSRRLSRAPAGICFVVLCLSMCAIVYRTPHGSPGDVASLEDDAEDCGQGSGEGYPVRGFWVSPSRGCSGGLRSKGFWKKILGGRAKRQPQRQPGSCRKGKRGEGERPGGIAGGHRAGSRRVSLRYSTGVSSNVPCFNVPRPNVPLAKCPEPDVPRQTSPAKCPRAIRPPPARQASHTKRPTPSAPALLLAISRPSACVCLRVYVCMFVCVR